ncbi:MAG TPA: SRPBCC family protein [Planctomycetota bacterium]|nr:SRPBCC family protein [Planctomycetota bacterium]
MLQKLWIALAVFVGLVAIGAIIVATQPSHFKVERTARIAAPPKEVFAQVNDLHKWQAWSPWAKLDPAAKNIYTGPEAGTGAALTWSGNDVVGEGTMTITESKSDEQVRIRLDFVRPYENTCTTTFAFKPEGDGTSVTWRMEGDKGFMGKAVCMFKDMDKMVGGEFDQGLTNLKNVVEKPGKTAAQVDPSMLPSAK